MTNILRSAVVIVKGLLAVAATAGLGSCAAMLATSGAGIYDGEETFPGRFQAVVGITYDSARYPRCTGTLIAADMVLTAAHCVCDQRPSHVFVGDDPRVGYGPTSGLYYAVKDLRIGLVCGVESSADGVDIAVLRLVTSVPKITPFVPASNAEIDEARSATIVGFGSVDVDGWNSDFRKREGLVPILSPNCSGRVSENYGCQERQEIVAGRPGSPDSCSGDSGGPILVRPKRPDPKAPDGDWRLAGVTSRAVLNSDSACGGGGVYERLRPVTWVWIQRAMGSMKSAT